MSEEALFKMGRSWRRVDGIDLLRGLAIFFVLMNHVNMMLLGAKVPYSKGWPPQLTYSLFWNGQFAVQMFFAISGYLITSTALRRWKALSYLDIKDFYLLRFARIFPLLALLLLVLSILHLAHVNHFVISPKTGGLLRALFAALTFHINLLEARTTYLPGSWDILWSLSVEEAFYLFFPIACRLLPRLRFLAIPLCLFVILGPLARIKAFNPNPVWREYSYLGGMDAIALGCLTAIVLHLKVLSKRAVWLFGGFGTALLVFSLGFSLRAYMWGLGRTGLNMTLMAVGTCLLIAAFTTTQWHAPSLLAPLARTGRLSYEIYLTHEFIIVSLFTAFVALGKPRAGVAPLFVLSIFLSILLGLSMEKFFSSPMNRWIRRRMSKGARQMGAIADSTDGLPLNE
jgi:peptidoglycan/LPS O-acetylase OafA/YrhL